MVVVDLDHPVLRRARELVRSVAQDRRVTPWEVGDARHCLYEGPSIEVLARHRGCVGEEADLLTPGLNRPLLLNIVIEIAVGDLRVCLVPDIPAAPHPRVVSAL